MSMEHHHNRKDPDPDDVGDVIMRVSGEFPYGTGAAESVALRRCYYRVKEADGPVDDDAVATAVWEESTTVTDQYPRRSAWWDVATLYLPLLPGIVREGRTWHFDPDPDDRGALPDDPAPPSREDVEAVIEDTDIPTAPDDRANRRNTLAVKRAVEHLKEHGTATSEEVKEQFRPSAYSGPVGHFDNPQDWMREVGRPMLMAVPGVQPPAVAGDPWRLVGVDADSDV